MKYISKILYLCILALFANLSFSAKQKILGPWMTGPLLAPAGHTIPGGHINIEPYIFYTDDYGFYNSQWKVTNRPRAINISPTAIITYGLNHWMDLQGSIPYNIHNKEGQTSTGIGDTTLTLGFQLLEQKPKSWVPDLRFTIGETFPLGEYQFLNPGNLGTDAMGAGSYQTTIGANFQRLHQFKDGKFLRTRLTLAYTIPTSVHITGINAFGGVPTTHGRESLGEKFNADLAFEYTLTQHWVPALDITYTHTNASSFKGFPGFGNFGSNAIAPLPTPSSDLITLAPAVEYNFNSSVGIIGGVWFSTFGRDTPDFVSGVVAINIYH